MPVRAFTRFLVSEYFSGFLLLLAAAAAMVLANSPLADDYWTILHGDFGFALGGVSLHMALAEWINDGLMVLFFLVVGLEIKREYLGGELSSPRKAALPAFCAAGGIIAPALVFMLLNREAPENWRGWAIPTATDIAFALGLLALAPRVPLSLKVFLTALAIIDDLIAILIIALFYGKKIQIDPFLFASGVLCVLFAMNISRVKILWPFLLLGFVLWVSVLHSGLHPTLAGVLLAFMIPVGDRRERSPLHRLENALHPVSAYFIMPVFALANAGLSFEGMSLENMFTPLAGGIALGLFLGKQMGVYAVGQVACRMKWAALPEKSTWMQFYGVTLLTGVGFTMSLFIGTLAFYSQEVLNEVRLGVLGGSALSALVGLGVLYFAKPRESRTAKARSS